MTCMVNLLVSISSVNSKLLYSMVGPSQVAQWLRIHLLVQDVWETQVRSLGWEDPLEKERATHPNILAWEIPWTEELQSMGFQRTTGYSL